MQRNCFHYVDCDVPAGMTLDEYRRRRAQPQSAARKMLRIPRMDFRLRRRPRASA